MSALSWMKRRALEREAARLRERIEARRLAIDAQPMTSVGTWFAGAGLSLASGFMAGVSSDIPSHVDRETSVRLLMRASAAALTAAAAFVGTHPPDSVAIGPVPASPGDASTEPGPGTRPGTGTALPDLHVTREELLRRLRRQSTGDHVA